MKNNISESELYLLFGAGLDEIRFHLYSPTDIRGLCRALSLNWSVGVEVPAIPGDEDRLREIIKVTTKLGVKFININELMINSSNYYKLKDKGFLLSKNNNIKKYTDMNNIYNIYNYGSIKGSRELVLELLQEARENKGLKIPTVHFCSLRSKQYVQVPNRLIQRAKKVTMPYEEVTWKGTLIYGQIESNSTAVVKKIKNWLINELKVSPKLIKLERHSLKTSWYILIKVAALWKEYSKSLTLRISERYPLEKESFLLRIFNKK
jgi:hypothetical protein